MAVIVRIFVDSGLPGVRSPDHLVVISPTARPAVAAHQRFGEPPHEGTAPAPRDVLFDTAGDEVVVFDSRTNTALSLTPVGSRVFAACDGATSPAALESELGAAALESALDELRRAGLLAGTSRRSVLVGGLAGAGTIAAMVALPTAAAAQSNVTGGAGTGGATAIPRANSDTYQQFYIVDTSSRSSPAAR